MNNRLECERKYVIKGIDENSLIQQFQIGNCSMKMLEQYYLDPRNVGVKGLVANFFGKDALSMMSEVRVRFVDNHQAYFTVKSNGEEQRTEFEKQIGYHSARDIVAEFATGYIKKNRYTFPNNTGKIEIDYYTQKDLMTAEMEYNPNRYSAHTIGGEVSRLVHFLNPNTHITDVTTNPEFKNKNLATKRKPNTSIR